jgi:hypothetical protein
MTHPRASAPTPQQRTIAQAAHCRRCWRTLSDGEREVLVGRLWASGDPWDLAWAAILSRRHALATWLDGDEPFEALPRELADGSSPRRLFSSHPFTDFDRWSIRTQSRASCSTPPA